MNTLNRQVTAKFNGEQNNVRLEVVRNGVYAGKSVEAGKTVVVSRSEAKRILTIHKGLFRIKID